MAILRKALCGIEAGIIGGLAMLVLFATASMLNRHVWWEVPNLLGSTFYHSRAFYFGAGVPTLAGGALQLTIAGTIGAIFSVVFGNVPSRHRLVLLGTLTGLGWFFLSNAWFWPRVNPLVPFSWPEPAAILCHVVFGVCLGYGAAFAAIPFAANGPSDAVDL
jgi:hypothetical protein